MDKSKAIRIITQAAKIYENQLCNKNILIVFNNPSHPFFIETKALPINFLHLTGVIVNKEKIYKDIEDTRSNYKEVFYLKSLNKRLSVNDFDLKQDGTTVQKLNAILATLNLQKNSKMIGDYNNNRVYLKTDKLVGNDNTYLGFTLDNGFYVPNTVIQGDIRIDAYSTSRILSIISKKIDEPFYNEIKYVVKKIDINRLLQALKEKVPISPDLFAQNEAETDLKEVNPTG